MKIVLAGGSGFCGRALRAFFVARGDEVVVLSRSAGEGRVVWDGKTAGDWCRELEGAQALINLAGRTVDCRYTERNRTEILNSRVDSTRVLGEAIAACAEPPRVWLNSSTATIYPDTRGELPANDESNEPGEDFSMNVAKAWEAAFFEHARVGVRQVALRTCIVLGKGGGAFVPLRNLTRLWLGGHQGDGSQWVTWMHIDDFVQQVVFLLEREDVSGPVNCTGVQPVSNRAFMAALRSACGRSWGLPQPAGLVKFGAVFVRTESELVLKSRKVVSAKLADAGYQWRWPELGPALADLCS